MDQKNNTDVINSELIEKVCFFIKNEIVEKRKKECKNFGIMIWVYMALILIAVIGFIFYKQNFPINKLIKETLFYTLMIEGFIFYFYAETSMRDFENSIFCIFKTDKYANKLEEFLEKEINYLSDQQKEKIIDYVFTVFKLKTDGHTCEEKISNILKEQK